MLLGAGFLRVRRRARYRAQMKNYSNEDLTYRVIGAAIAVHRKLGPGLLERSYAMCLRHALKRRGIQCRSEVPVPVEFEGLVVPSAYRIDLLVEERVVVELKAVEALHPLHRAQALTYLRHVGLETGLLLNFNVQVMTDGIVRIHNKQADFSNPPEESVEPHFLPSSGSTGSRG